MKRRGYKRAMLAAIGLLSLSVFVLAAAAAGGTTRYVSPSGVDNPTCSKNSPCKHVQQAVDVASAGDTISLAKGNYVEQVSIAKDLTLTGAGSGASTISAPAVLVPDSHGFLNIVEINSGASVQMSQLAVAGPGPGTCGSIDRGISVIGEASLAITQAAVSDIRDNPPSSDCNNGFGVGAGTQIRGSQLTPDPEVGHLTIDHTTVTGYQRAAIFVINDGSTGQIDHNTVKGTPCSVPVPAPAESGCFSVVRRPSITTRSAATNATTGLWVRPGLVQRLSVVGHSHDRGCLVDCGLTQQPEHERRRHLHRHRGHDRPQRRGLPLVGIATDFGNSAQVDHNSTTGGIYGIMEFGGTGTFSHNSASGSSGADLWWDGTGTPSFSHNSCGTASPSKAIWGCH